MKNLIIDIGNTFSKIAIYDGNSLLDLIKIEDIQIKDIASFVKDKDIKAAIISSVVFHPGNINNYLKEKYIYIELTDKTPLPIQNLYATPNSLGKDRLAAAVGAYSLFPKEHVLVIDAGTCIKYDFKNDRNEYFGGAISPGLEMRLKSLNDYTDKLPLCKLKQTNKLIGTTTEESILSGVINGAIAEITGIIEQYKEKFNPLKIILSGGDAIYFDNRLKNSIFAVSNIVLLGLNEILDYNVK